ncbi:hypothetical protein FB639_004292, partial [Coemansia asiatica]
LIRPGSSPASHSEKKTDKRKRLCGLLLVPSCRAHTHPCFLPPCFPVPAHQSVSCCRSACL